jgi:hypothetical protein
VDPRRAERRSFLPALALPEGRIVSEADPELEIGLRRDRLRSWIRPSKSTRRPRVRWHDAEKTKEI